VTSADRRIGLSFVCIIVDASKIHRDTEENAMNEFIAKFSDDMQAVLSGFDRLLIRSVTRDRPALEIRPNFQATQGMKLKMLSATLCSRKAVSFFWRKFFPTKFSCQKRQPFSIYLEKCKLDLR
jgi:hypothetical protein